MHIKCAIEGHVGVGDVVTFAVLKEMLLLCHGDEAHVVFWVAPCFGVTDDVNSILLSL